MFNPSNYNSVEASSKFLSSVHVGYVNYSLIQGLVTAASNNHKFEN